MTIGNVTVQINVACININKIVLILIKAQENKSTRYSVEYGKYIQYVKFLRLRVSRNRIIIQRCYNSICILPRSDSLILTIERRLFSRN